MSEKCPSGVEQTSNWGFRVLIAVVIATGIFLRFFNLEIQDYWHDEAITSLHIAGHTKIDGKWFLYAQPRQFAELITYCEPLKNDFARVWFCWGDEQPEKAPLFYILEYFWACAFGNAVFTMRLLPAILSLLQLPAYFWFGIELFGSRTAAWLMTALIAVSPTAILWAQEAREYGLYTALIAFSCTAFLKVMKTPSKQNWLLYGGILIVSLYTSFLTAFVVAAQLAFLILKRKYDQLATFAKWNLAAMFLLTPWVLVNVPHITAGYEPLYWMAKCKDRGLWLTGLLGGGWMPLFYPGHYALHIYSDQKMTLGLGAFFYSLYQVFRLRSYPGPLFLLLLLLVTSFPFVGTDLLLDGIRALILKYMTHIHVVLIASVAFAFALHTDWKGIWYRQLLWWFVLISFFLISIDSSLSITTTHTSFLKRLTYGQNLRPIADELNRHSPGGNPATIITEISPNNQIQMFALSRIVKPEVKVILVEKFTLKSIPSEHGALYLFNPQPDFVRELQQSGYVLTPLKDSIECYRL